MSSLRAHRYRAAEEHRLSREQRHPRWPPWSRTLPPASEVFEPLSKAYSIPKEEPGRDMALEEALKTACSAPYEIVMKTKEAAEIIVRLEIIGSRLALSDVGVAAAMLQACVKGAAMNVYINTKLMKDRSYAEELNAVTEKTVEEVDAKCAAVYEGVRNSLTGGDNK